MSIKIGDVVYEKEDKDQKKWTLVTILDDPKRLIKVAIIKSFTLDPNTGEWSNLTVKKLPLSELKKVDEL